MPNAPFFKPLRIEHEASHTPLSKVITDVDVPRFSGFCICLINDNGTRDNNRNKRKAFCSDNARLENIDRIVSFGVCNGDGCNQERAGNNFFLSNYFKHL